MENKANYEVAPTYEAAVRLHKEILFNAELASSALLEFCKGLKKNER